MPLTVLLLSHGKIEAIKPPLGNRRGVCRRTNYGKGQQDPMRRKMVQDSLFILLAILSGAVIAIYLPMNSMIARHVGSPIAANITFFLGALVTSVVIFALFGDFHSLGNISRIPPYLFITGIAGAFMVLLATILIPKLGARRMFLLLLSGQIIMAMIISHFGLLESPKDPITVKKMIGAGVLVIGAIISMI
jgi:transporter family-2 protein